LNHIIKQQSWYPQIFRNCIFNIEDSLIADQDRAQIFDGLRSKGRPSLGIFYQFLGMIDIEQRPNLNLEHYLAFLRQLNSNDFDRIFSDMFYDYGYGASGQVELDRFLKDYKLFLDEGDGKENVKGFEVLLYMFKCQGSWKVTPMYEQFFHRYPELGRAQITKALTATDGQLTNKIQQFCKRYDILL
jgi:hypothetical protein